MTEPVAPISPAPLSTGAPVHYVGFWARAFASLIDVIVTGAIIAVVAVLVDPSHRFAGERHGLMHFTLEYLLPAVAVLAFWFKFSATPGKMVISAVVVDAATLGPPTRQQFVLRYAGYYVSLLVVCLGYVWIAFDERKQGWHDKIAGTLVIRRPRG